MNEFFLNNWAEKANIETAGQEFCFDYITIGEIELETGKVVICDPLAPFEKHIVLNFNCTGRHPVELAVVQSPKEFREQIWAAIVRVSDFHELTWSKAQVCFFEQKDMPNRNVFSAPYGVDTGIGSLMNLKVAEQHFAQLDGDDGESYSEALMNRFYGCCDSRPFWLKENTEKGKMFLFESGQGDGSYFTWVGKNENGEDSILLTDFSFYAKQSKINEKKWWNFWK